jgi:hypothetical protein
MMATPRFNSQHSEIMLDVSAYHSSSEASPQQMPREHKAVACSPVVQASQSEDRVPESVERVEDSYQEYMPNRPPIQPSENEDEDEDELYAISPKGRACLDAKIAAKKNTDAEQVSYNT